MNILIFSWRGPGHPHAGGAEYSTHQHAKGWIKAGHKVTLFTSSFEGAKSEDEVDGITIIRRGSQVFSVQLWAVIWYLFGKHSGFDIVMDEVHGIPFFTPLFVRAPKFVFIHEVAKEVWRLNPWPRPFNLIPALIGTLFEPMIFKTLYKKIPFMTVSESTKNDLINWDIPENHITVVHNGFERENYKLQKKDSKRAIIYLGALSKDKGIEDALACFEIISKNNSDYQFWIVGKGDNQYLKYLKKKAHDLGIEKNVTFFGFVSEERKYDLLSRASLLINPSIREGWGLVVIEAASVGTPTIGYNVVGLRDSIKDGQTGILCQANPVSCAEAVLSLDEKKYQKLKQNSLTWSKNFDWKKSVKQSLELIKSVVI